MIDFHTHILPGIDDGSKDVEMSLEMIKLSENEGVKQICLTPHFIVGEYEISKELYEKKLIELKNQYSSQSIDFLSGLEVYINPEIAQYYRDKKIWGYNNSRYLLVELPMQQFPIYTEKVFYQLRLEGAIPVIAHPERNLSIIKDRGLLENLIEQGTIVQMNSGSLTGSYGSTVKNFAEELVKMNMVHIIGSDAHNDTKRAPFLQSGYNILKAMNKELYYWIIENQIKIVKNEEINIPDIKLLKKKKMNIFDLFKKK
jgi:protein-tyrosine phosphatase